VIRYSVKTTNNATFEAVTVEQARNQCNVSHREDDQFLRAAILAAQSYIEKQLECVICLQTVQFRFDRFPKTNTPIPLPLFPIQEIESVSYINPDAVATTLTLAKVVQPQSYGKYEMKLVDWEYWPQTRQTPNAVTIQALVGWVSPEAIPAAIKQAILMLVGHWYLNRESVIVGQTSKEIEFATSMLLESMRPGENELSDQLGEGFSDE
jgi:uncharacterized phiE125 gp8 family phage protein